MSSLAQEFAQQQLKPVAVDDGNITDKLLVDGQIFQPELLKGLLIFNFYFQFVLN